jgi:hypothetical protein
MSEPEIVLTRRAGIALACISMAAGLLIAQALFRGGGRRAGEGALAAGAAAGGSVAPGGPATEAPAAGRVLGRDEGGAVPAEGRGDPAGAGGRERPPLGRDEGGAVPAEGRGDPAGAGGRERPPTAPGPRGGGDDDVAWGPAPSSGSAPPVLRERAAEIAKKIRSAAATDAGSRAESLDPRDADPPPGTGLLGRYWKLADQTLTEFPSAAIAGRAPDLTRIDPAIDFEGYGFKLGFEPRNFAASWAGWIRAAEDGVYTFALGSDDGSTLSIDGARLIENGGLHPHVERSADLYLERGLHTIEVRYFQNYGDASAVLSWVPPAGEPGVIPAEVLYPSGALGPEYVPRIDAVEPLFAHFGERVTIRGERFPARGAPLVVTFDGVPMQAEARSEVEIAATLPPGVDVGDIVVAGEGVASQGFRYEAGDAFGLAAAYTQSADEIRSLAGAPAPGAGSFRRVEDRILFRSPAEFRLPFAPRRFAARYEGLLYAPKAGEYELTLISDDGGRLSIEGAPAVAVDGLHPMQAGTANVFLAEGFHAVAIDFFQNEGDAGLIFEWRPPGAASSEPVPRRALYASTSTAVERPRVDEVEPPSARPGETVEIRGRGFVGDGRADRVTFSGVAATVEAAAPGRLVVRVPDGARSGPLVVQSGELVADPVDFRVLGRGLQGAYYSFGDQALARIPDLDGRAPDFVRVDPQIHFSEDWTFRLPFVPEHFAARWTGSIDVPRDGVYRFRMGSDDGSRLAIDGRPVVDNDGLHGYLEVEGAVELAAGRHAIEVDFFENGGYAAVNLLWTPPGAPGPSLVPETTLYPDR